MARLACGSDLATAGNPKAPSGIAASGGSAHVILEIDNAQITTYTKLLAALRPLLLYYRGILSP